MKWLLLLLCSGLSASAQGTVGNIVGNGDFEDLANFTFAPWRGGGGFVVYAGHGDPYTAPSGTNFAIAGNTFNPLSQDLVTVPGTKYDLRFAYGGNDAQQQDRGPLKVLWGGTVVKTFPELLLNTPSWQYYDVLVQAITTDTRLTFSCTGYAWVDNVSAVAVPEPLPCRIFAFAVLILGITRRGRITLSFTDKNQGLSCRCSVGDKRTRPGRSPCRGQGRGWRCPQSDSPDRAARSGCSRGEHQRDTEHDSDKEAHNVNSVFHNEPIVRRSARAGKGHRPPKQDSALPDRLALSNQESFGSDSASGK
jgi:hypothetical protein